MLEKLAAANEEKVLIVKVDANANREWAARAGLKGVPTMQFYKGGKKLTQFAGAYPEAELQKKFDKYAAMTVDPETGGTTENVIQPMPKDWLPPGVSRQ